jgi:uncharacterized protein
MSFMELNTESLTAVEKEAINILKKSISGFLGDKLIKMVLFGSKARREDNHDSDIDIAVIVSDLSRETKRNLLNLVADIEVEYLVPLSTIIFDNSEFNRLLAQERRLALDIMKEGIAI